MLTGESTAIPRSQGSPVHAGTQNLGSPLRVRVTAVAGNTVLAGIVALLERAQAERPRLARAADRAAAWFLGRILIGAAIVFVVWWFVDPSRAFPATLAVLVVTCPCALSLATPAVLAAATADLARRGVLVAHSDAFEALAKASLRPLGQDGHAHARPGARRGNPPPARCSCQRLLRTRGRTRAHVRAPDRAGVSRQRRGHRDGERRDGRRRRGTRGHGARASPAHRHARLRARPGPCGARNRRRHGRTVGQLGVSRRRSTGCSLHSG